MSVSEENVKQFIDFLSRIVPKGAYRFDETGYLAWYPFLKNFDHNELRWYLDYAGDNLDEFPSIKKIKAILIERRNGFLNVDPVTALMNGVKNKNAVTEPINALALKFGGWTVIGMWPVDQWEFKRKAITDVWETVKKNYRIESTTTPARASQIQKEEERPFVKRTPEELEKIKAMFAKMKDDLAKSKSLTVR